MVAEETPSEDSIQDAESNLDEDDGTPKKVPCESIRITYEDPLTQVHRAEDVFLDPRDVWSRGKSLLLVNAASITALQERSDKEQHLAFSCQSATERCRRDYLREQRVLVDELQRLVESNPSLMRAIQVEAQDAIDKAMQVAEQSPDISSMASTEEERKLALEFYVPRHDIDEEILRVLKQAQIDLGDEVCTRLMLQKVRNMNADDLRQREQIKTALDALSSGGLVTDTGPVDKESREKLIHSMIIQAQNQGASWTEIGMTVMDAAANRWAQMKDEGYTQNILQATEDAMTDHLREQYTSMVARQKDYSTKLHQYYALLAQQEEHAATLLEMQSKAEVAEETLTKKETTAARLVANYEQRKAERAVRRENAKAERQEARAREKREAREKYQALKTELQAAANEEEEVVTNSPEAVAKLMSVQEKARLKQLEEVVSQMQEKQTQIKTRIDDLHTEAAEAKDMKEKTRERVAQARMMLEKRKQEVQMAKQEVAKVEEKKQTLKKEVRELAEKKAKVDKQVREIKAPVPPDIDGMLTKMEAEVEGVRAPYQELCEEESRMLAKEKRMQLRLEEAREDLKARRDAEPEVAAEAPRPRSRTAESYSSSKSASKEGLLRGYPQRVAEELPTIPRFEHLYNDLRAREKQLQHRQHKSAQVEAREILAKLPRLSDEEQSQRSNRSSTAQAPVWFMRDEDLRVKIALSSQRTAELRKVVDDCDETVCGLKKDLEACGWRLAEGFAQSSELLSEAPRELSEALDRLPDQALRSYLEGALRTHEECQEEAEDVWRLTKAGCDIGTRKHELELEESVCSLREQDLLRACRNLCSAAQEAVSASAPSDAAAAVRSYVTRWRACESQLPLRWPRDLWPPVLRAAEVLDAERSSQESLTNQLYLETKRQALLEAELAAPAEAKRALAALRLFSVSEGSQANETRFLS